MEEIKVNIFNLVGNGDCTLPEDGNKIFDILKKALNDDKKIIISFKNINSITSAFLNSAIGKLYGEFEESRIKDSLEIEDILIEDKIILKRVISGAKLYFKDPERMINSIKKILGEEDE